MRKQVHQVLGGRFIKMIPVIKGTPDRLILLPGGRMYLVELKAYGGRLSAAQKLFIAKAAELGTTVTVLTGRAQVDAWITLQASHFDRDRRKTRNQ